MLRLDKNVLIVHLHIIVQVFRSVFPGLGQGKAFFCCLCFLLFVLFYFLFLFLSTYYCYYQYYCYYLSFNICHAYSPGQALSAEVNVNHPVSDDNPLTPDVFNVSQTCLVFHDFISLRITTYEFLFVWILFLIYFIQLFIVF